MTYVATEPDAKMVYIDTQGGSHDSREEAIGANFDIDWDDALGHAVEYAGLRKHPGLVQIAIEYMIKNHADMLRVKLGDRDAT